MHHKIVISFRRKFLHDWTFFFFFFLLRYNAWGFIPCDEKASLGEERRFLKMIIIFSMTRNCRIFVLFGKSLYPFSARLGCTTNTSHFCQTLRRVCNGRFNDSPESPHFMCFWAKKRRCVFHHWVMVANLKRISNERRVWPSHFFKFTQYSKLKFGFRRRADSTFPHREIRQKSSPNIMTRGPFPRISRGARVR